MRTLIILFLFFGSILNDLNAKQLNLVKNLDLSSYKYQFKGAIDNRLNIFMFLNQADDKLNGVYYYNGNKYYLTLEGTISKTNHTIIFESNYKGKITGKFEGLLNGDTFSGTWKNAENTKEYSFDLATTVQQKAQTVGLNKNQEKESNSFSIIVISIVAGVVVLYLIYIKKNKNVVSQNRNEYEEQKITNAGVEKIFPEVADKEVVNSFIEDPIAINKKKGDEFEAFVINKFDPNYFKFKAWRSDKAIDGYYPESNKYPDLEFEFRHNSYSAKFAIECKYRSDYNSGYVEIANYKKLEDYRNFEKANRMQVYLVLGVGGEPSKPKDLYLIPLPHINSGKIHKNKLREDYCKSISANFFYDRSINTLT